MPSPARLARRSCSVWSMSGARAGAGAAPGRRPSARRDRDPAVQRRRAEAEPAPPRPRTAARLTRLVLQLAQLLPRPRRLLRARVLADQLGEGQAGVGGIAHLDEQVPLRPQRRRRLVAFRVLRHHVVELGDRLVLVATQRVAARRPVERVVREPRLLVVGGEAVQLRHRPRAVLAAEAVEQAEVLGALGDVEGAGGLLLARDLLPPLVVGRGDRWAAAGRRRARRGRRGFSRAGRRRRRGGRPTAAGPVLELGEALLERRQPVVARRTSAAGAPRGPFLHVGPQALDLLPQLLQLPPLVLENGAQLVVLLHQLGAGRTSGERGEREHGRACGARAHWPRITEWTRRLRAQQASFSSWQRGSSLP